MQVMKDKKSLREVRKLKRSNFSERATDEENFSKSSTTDQSSNSNKSRVEQNFEVGIYMNSGIIYAVLSCSCLLRMSIRLGCFRGRCLS